MKKKLNGKLVLNKETLRILSRREMDGVQGGAPTVWCTTVTSNPTDTCESCVHCSVTTC